MSAEQTKVFLSKWHNFHLLCAWLTVTTKGSMLARKAAPQAGGGVGVGGWGGLAGPLQQPSPVKVCRLVLPRGTDCSNAPQKSRSLNLLQDDGFSSGVRCGPSACSNLIFAARLLFLTQQFKCFCRICAQKYTPVVFLSLIFEFLCKAELIKTF